MTRLEAADIEELLVRDDKVSLGGEGRVLWAPESPAYADAPGFWDHACYLEHSIQPLFTVTLLDAAGRPIPLRSISRRWVPGHLNERYEGAQGLEVEEIKTFVPDVLVSRLRWTSSEIRAVVWTLIPPGKLDSAGVSWRATHWEWSVTGPGPVGIALALGADTAPRSRGVSAAESSAELPRWETTPFYEQLRGAGLSGGGLGGTAQRLPTGDSLVYLGLEYTADELAGADWLTVGISLANGEGEAGHRLEQTLQGDPEDTAGSAWADYWASVPSFSCTDPYLERAYWYRWFGLRLNSVVASPEHGLIHPCVFEGVNAGWFRHAISYSAHAHMRELRWMRDPAWGRGSLLNFVEHQLPDGSFPGHIATTPESRNRSFYHSNWGTGVVRLHEVHPERSFLEEAYGPLAGYARYLQRERDPENSHLYDVFDHWETGQEYSSRYLPAHPEADDGKAFRLKGVDATCYAFELIKALRWMSSELGRQDETRQWERQERATARALRDRLWDPELQFFTDLVPATGRRTGVLAAVGFYPFMSDLARAEHLAAIYKHLLDPEQFWTAYPVPSLALTDPLASAEGTWRGARMSCPWNGRSWLMTNSHVCEALARAGRVLDASLRSSAYELIQRCVRLTFLEGRLDRPTSYEYYNPLTGQAPHFRGTDDYMHSWLVDLILGQVVGLQPGLGNELLIDPLAEGLERFAVEDAWMKGRRVDVHWEQGAGFTVDVDGVTRARREELGPLRVDLGR